jgi:hypothetical protein
MLVRVRGEKVIGNCLLSWVARGRHKRGLCMVHDRQHKFVMSLG